MSVSIKVAIRCRPFTIDGKLGVKLRQVADEEGEVELINCDYSTTRFPFTYAWWSAYGYPRHLKGDNMPDADNMLLIDQNMAYQSCGMKIKEDLLGGNAVVLFAYGLSGSGKTFTVFGPDAMDAPEAWFKHKEPHPLWGIFPRLAYEIFQEKETKDGWKITMKYFQNVVDTVRDLMSSSGEEQHYKNGMRKDPDGFMDIEWCESKVINSWNDLRQQFLQANARKAIAPTQFNPMSTRGHCIMVLEVEMPDLENEGMKKRGRVYVCDLAGTEPAGDIVYALYNKHVFEDGSFEYEFAGAHPDKKKSKELQEQGMKINLSLSEMAQFFMKMAEAVLKKKLTPGMSIPGCNSFFLCKYLKDTMLQARTYLFCAIRPEVEFLKYTFATLGFAKNASVVKLSPKKATVACSPQERKLMAELDAMKELVARLQAQASQQGGNGSARGTVSHKSGSTKSSSNGDDSESDRIIAELQAKLAQKQSDLNREVIGLDGASYDEKKTEEIAMYANRGISLTAYETENVLPYFVNLDEDAFRSNRFMYILKKEVTIFGNKLCDVQLMSLAIVRDHCSVRYDETSKEIFIRPVKGDIWVNGKHFLANKDATQQSNQIKLSIYDRVALGDQLMMLRYPVVEDDYTRDSGVTAMTGAEAVEEYQEGMVNNRNTNAANGNANGDLTDDEIIKIEAERKRIREERDNWEKEKTQFQHQRNEEEYQRAMSTIDNAILDLLPKTKEAKSIVDLMNRFTMVFDVVLEKQSNTSSSTGSGYEADGSPSVKNADGTSSSSAAMNIPKVKISVTNTHPKLSILIDPQEFLPKLSLLKDEMMKLRNAIDSNRDYMIPERHDPLFLMFDNDFLLGTATHWPEYTIYNLETTTEEKMQDIKSAAVPYNTIGLLDVSWQPLGGPNEGDEDKEIRDIDTDEDFLNHPWHYKLDIKGATDLPVFCEMAYVQYKFYGETFTSEAVQQTTFSPVFDYSKIHSVTCATPEFLAFLKEPLEISVHVTQHIDTPSDRIGTLNDIVRESIRTNEPLGYNTIPTGGSNSPPRVRNDIQVKYDEIAKEFAETKIENDQLKNRVAELEAKLKHFEDQFTNSKKNKSIADARLTDSVLSTSASSPRLNPQATTEVDSARQTKQSQSQRIGVAESAKNNSSKL